MDATPVVPQAVSRDTLGEYARAGYLYAIVDATDQPLVPVKMVSLGIDKARSLFLGGPREDYWGIAPFLVQADEALLSWLEAELAEQPWGIFALSPLPLLPVFEHLRDQLVVTLADGQRWHYRFYDPRVLKRHLERGQIGTLFGPVRGYVVPSPPQLAGTAFILKAS